MSLGKKDIVNNISSEAFLDKVTSSKLLNSFLKIVKTNTSKKIKLSKFGSFYLHESPQRIGRNPKTKKEYLIPKRKKVIFKASEVVKKDLN